MDAQVHIFSEPPQANILMHAISFVNMFFSNFHFNLNAHIDHVIFFHSHIYTPDALFVIPCAETIFVLCIPSQSLNICFFLSSYSHMIPFPQATGGGFGMTTSAFGASVRNVFFADVH